jgi:outer membrane protein OmpA-like peptidoglycan-associated protein
MRVLPINKRAALQIVLAAGLAGAVSHWAAAQAPPDVCPSLWRDLEAAVKTRNLNAAKDANRKIQVGEGCNPLRVKAKSAMVDAYLQEDARQEKAGAQPAERLAALSGALVSYGKRDDWELRLKIADLKLRQAEAGDKAQYPALSQAYYDVLQAAEAAPASRARPPRAELERVAMLAYQYQALSPTPPKGRGLFGRGVRQIFVGRTPVPLQFVYNKAELTDLGLSEAERVVKELKDDNNPRIHLIGHTDPTGSHPFNDELSLRRAERIKKFLTDHGYPASQITIEGRGKRESEPFKAKIVNPTRFSPAEIDQILRRVEVVWKE